MRAAVPTCRICSTSPTAASRWSGRRSPARQGRSRRRTPKPRPIPVKLTVLCDDRAGLLKEFTAIISDDGTNIRSSSSNATADGGAVVDFVIETVDVRHLNRLVDKMRRVQGVRDVQRVQKIYPPLVDFAIKVTILRAGLHPHQRVTLDSIPQGHQ
jgi:predicted amino acid-binding ACT domain protein